MSLSVVWLVACSDPTNHPPPSDAPPLDSGTEPTDTATTEPPPDGLEASCAEDPDNALRAKCTVRIDPPGPVEVAFAPQGGGEERLIVSDKVAATHELTLYGMTWSTDHTWQARPKGGAAGGPAVDGLFRSGPEQAGLDYGISATGTPSFPYLLIPDVCGGTARAVILRTSDGRVVWYDDLAAGLENAGNSLDVVGVTDQGTILGLTFGGAIVETTLGGERRLVVQRGEDFDAGVHHDVWQRGGLTYVLFGEAVRQGGTDWVVDGFLVFGSDGEPLAEWRLADHLELPTQGPGGVVDYSHANAVWTDAEGDIYLSLRHLSAAVKIEGDLDSPAFGEVLWQLVGSESDLTSDFALTASTPAVGTHVDFQQQHNVHLLPDGRMAMFDNRLDYNEQSRVLQLTLDESTWTADITGAWTLPMHCMFHGAAWHTAAGNPVATCGPWSMVFEFDGASSGSSAKWEAEIQCGGGPGMGSIPRAVPLEAL